MQRNFRNGSERVEIDLLPGWSERINAARCRANTNDDIFRFEKLDAELLDVQPFRIGTLFKHPVIKVETVNINNGPHRLSGGEAQQTKQRLLQVSPPGPLNRQHAAGGYPNTTVDDKGEQLTGARCYVLHFDAGKLPPVATFWNMSMYGSDMLFVENEFGRYSIGSTTDGLKKNADGSLTVAIQKDKPADTSNWLPAPEGAFNLTLRLYGPQTPILDGSYRLPAVKRVN
ncbi:hypothetical protein ABID62_006306 [Bradyrhizobium sp. S3.9.1]